MKSTTKFLLSTVGLALAVTASAQAAWQPQKPIELSPPPVPAVEPTISRGPSRASSPNTS